MHKEYVTIFKQALHPLTRSFKPRHVYRSVVLPKLKLKLKKKKKKKRGGFKKKQIGEKNS